MPTKKISSGNTCRGVDQKRMRIQDAAKFKRIEQVCYLFAKLKQLRVPNVRQVNIACIVLQRLSEKMHKCHQRHDKGLVRRRGGVVDGQWTKLPLELVRKTADACS